jgi:hypothetical protein
MGQGGLNVAGGQALVQPARENQANKENRMTR